MLGIMVCVGLKIQVRTVHINPFFNPLLPYDLQKMKDTVVKHS